MSLRPALRVSTRRKNSKVAVAATEVQKKRDHTLVVRNNKKEESLEKKRRDEDEDLSPTVVQGKLQDLSHLVSKVMSQNSRSQLEATTELAALLSLEQNSSVELLVNAKVVPRFVEFLLRSDMVELQLEAAKALKNIAAATPQSTKVVVDSGAVPPLVLLLSNQNQRMRNQALLALGTIAGDCSYNRDIVLSHGAMAPLLAHLNSKLGLPMLKNATWTLANFCRRPLPPFKQVKAVLPNLAKLIESKDDVVLTEVCEALSYISSGTHEYIQGVIEAGVCQRVVQFLQQPSLVSSALNILGNMVTGNDSQTQHVINNGALQSLYSILAGDHNKSVKRDACWVISNITAGSIEQIQAVLDANIVGLLVSLSSAAEFDVKKQAAWAISNAITEGTEKQITFIVSEGCIKPLCDLLACQDPTTIAVCLQGLTKILNFGEVEQSEGHAEDKNMFASYIESIEGLDKIEVLLTHENPEIYDLATNILEKYFPCKPIP